MCSQTPQGFCFKLRPTRLFANTPEGQQQRLAYHEAHKLDNYESLLDYNDVKNGRETPAERRARQRRT